MDERATLIVAGFEFLLWAAGAVLLGRIVLNPLHRASLREARLPAWNLSVSDFFLFLFFIMAGTVVAGIAGNQVALALGLRGDAVTVCNGAAAQLGMLAGYFLFKARRPSADSAGPGAAPPPHDSADPSAPPVLAEPPTSPAAPASPSSLPPVLGSGVFVSGLMTFLMALPILIVAVRVWELVLTFFGLPVDRQDLVGMFANAESPLLIAVMLTLAIVLAPITEELVFRAGLYRFLRTRIPRWIALTAPALFFASLHVDWHTFRGLASLAPLLALAVVFSLAYEHTGRIGTVIVAHALFNLNTVLMIFAGAADE